LHCLIYGGPQFRSGAVAAPKEVHDEARHVFAFRVLRTNASGAANVV
jgi:hypothetical protein